MTAAAGGDGDPLGARIAALRSADQALAPLGAAMLAVVEFAIATDSRAIAKALGVEHALVLREISALEGKGRLVVEQRDARTMRTWIRLA